jgi:NAD(P)-dependent dehydrogenase (short-subunit alcohol dehydrogenase family)
MRFFITGISRGLGKAITKECLSKGHEVWGVARTNPSDIEELIHYTKCDIANYNEVDNVYKEMISANYIPDVLILNVAVVKDDFYNGIDLKAARETLEVNFFGNLYWLQLFFHHFSGMPESCIFVNISSVSTFRAIVGNKISISYPASKSAMDMIFEGMRVHCGNKKMRFIT